MVEGLLAEAGLSECAQSDIDCTPGFDAFLIIFVIIGVLVVLWLGLAGSATVAIVSSKIGVVDRLLWVAVVWAVPVVGAVAWLARARR
ncbi:hypothetical protein B2J88_46975 [Rhodococcus sp. SRB_17]|nr:hypothetical protein [Rhodococcus sp. SRB_17]